MTFEIYYDDLTPEAQQRYLEFFGISNAAENNADILPIFEIYHDDLRDES